MDIKIKYRNQDTKRIEKLSVGNWIDLSADETIEIKRWEYKVIPLGVAMELPFGFEANIVPRSSTFAKFRVLQVNSYGVIDDSYCGDNDWWGFGALAIDNTIIKRGDRICQFRINKIQPDIEFVEVELLGNSDRGGFGSTGT